MDGGPVGICGYANGTGILINESFNTGNVTVSGSVGAGGIFGSNLGSVSVLYCYNTGIVTCNGYTGTTSHCGGISGGIDYTGTVVGWCYSRGQVSGYKSSGVGLLVGLMSYYDGNPILKYSYATPSNSKPLIGKDCGGGTSTGNETITTDTETNKNQMQLWTQEEITTKLTDKFVIDTNNINDGYPVLKWQIEE